MQSMRNFNSHTASQNVPSSNSLKYPNFRLLWITTGLVAGGTWFQQVTLGWLAYELTRSPLHVAGVVGIRTLPLLLSPITGVLADRVDRKKLLVVDQALVTVLVFAFALLLLADLHRIWHLYAFALAFGFLWAVNNPVRYILVANTVPEQALMHATAMVSMAFNAMRALGPAVGGFVIAYLGPGVNFLIQSILFLVAFLLIYKMKTPYYTANRSITQKTSPFRNLTEGVFHVIKDPITRIITLMTFAVSFFMLAIVFNQLPVYTAEVLFNEDGTYLGILMMSLGVGGFIGTAIIAYFASYKQKGLLASSSFLFSAICVITLSQVTNLWIAIVVLILQQMFMQIVMTTHMTIINTVTPDEIRGRVVGVYQMEIGMLPFGGLLAGWISSIYGVDQALLVSGLTGFAIILFASIFIPHYRKIVL
ncbi:MAG: hypothetical protein CL763_01775 [Chloroflexi bacterium]|nr:hypothetical protein [Chloroflexota bacterium]|tara:strand:- start:3355 stop:4617 length:1263 start_codon:yes stop_codon:yes gene_type:complete